MHIGIIGAGHIGSALARHFHTLQHPVRIANSRGPATLAAVAEDTGATPVAVSEVATGVDLLVIAIPMRSVVALPTDLLRGLPAGSPVVDTGNYVPLRDGVIAEIDGGLAESEWTARVLQRPVVKAFNNLTAYSLAHGGRPKGSAGRIALPVSGDDVGAKQVVLALVDAMGFDGVDAGPLADSWRQQLGTPAWCTDYDAEALRAARARADRTLTPPMRDATMQKLLSLPPDTPPQDLVRFARSLWTEHRAG